MRVHRSEETVIVLFFFIMFVIVRFYHLLHGTAQKLMYKIKSKLVIKILSRVYKTSLSILRRISVILALLIQNFTFCTPFIAVIFFNHAT